MRVSDDSKKEMQIRVRLCISMSEEQCLSMGTIGYRVGQDPGYHVRRLPAMVP